MRGRLDPGLLLFLCRWAVLHILQTLLGSGFWESLFEKLYDKKLPKDSVILLNKLPFYPLEYLC